MSELNSPASAGENSWSFWPRTWLKPRDETLTQRFFRTRPLDVLPKTISHERIYIVPSRRGWMFVLSLLVMLVGAINYNLSLGYALCFLLTGLFSASLIATYRNLSGISVQRINQPETTLGQHLDFAITIGNPSGMPRYGLDIGNSTTTTRFNVDADKQQCANLPAASAERGLQACGRLTISSDYPMGLWFTWSYIHTDCSGLVYPKAENSPPPLPFDQTANASGLSRTTTQGDFESLREYQPGDTPGSIAWKTVARGMGLFTRQFAAENPGADLSLTWADTRALTDPEERLSRLAAWALLASQKDIPFSLEMPGQMLSRGSGEQHLRQVMQTLALFGTDDGHSRD